MPNPAKILAGLGQTALIFRKVEFKFFNNNLKIIISSLLAAVVLFLAISKAISAGQQAAQSQTIAQTAKNLSLGLKYFYNDQNRFPSASEFSDQNLMLNYFSTFPPQEFVSANCSQSFVYKRVDANNFQLSFCLPQSEGQYAAGWNTISVQP